MMDIIAKLEKYRLENKIPQQEVAIKLGVAFSTVNRWLNRKAKPNTSSVVGHQVQHGEYWRKGAGKIQSYHIEKLLGKKR